MDAWITYLRVTKMEVEQEDRSTVISDEMLGSKMLRGSGLPRKERAQVYRNCGGTTESKRVETILRVTYPDLAAQERRTGLVPDRVPKKPFVRRSHEASDRGRRHPPTGKFSKSRTVHTVEDGTNAQEDDESSFASEEGEAEKAQEESFEAEEAAECYLQDSVDRGDRDLPADEEEDEAESEEWQMDSSVREAFLAG